MAMALYARSFRMKIFCGLMVLLIFCLAGQPTSAKTVHHYVFFDMDHERIRDSSFLETKAFEGAQLKYTWKELEPEKDHYEFSSIRKDLAFLSANGKKLFV